MPAPTENVVRRVEPFSFHVDTLLEGAENGKELPGIHVKEHHLVQAVAGNAVVAGEGEEVRDPRIRGSDQLVLKLDAIFLPGCRFEEGVVATFFERVADGDRVTGDAFNLCLRDDEAVDPPL